MLGFYTEKYFRLRVLLRALFDMDLLCPEAHSRPVFLFNRKNFCTSRRKRIGICVESKFGGTLVEAIAEMFDTRYYNFEARDEYFVSEWIRNGWICDKQAENEILYMLIESLQAELFGHKRQEDDVNATLRVARQMLALGFFRKPHVEQTFLIDCRRFYGDFKLRLKCQVCGIWHKEKHTAEVCPATASFLAELLEQPLSLQQLSRIEIRCSIGINRFENRIKTLPLPPSLLAYVWRAGEMLTDTSLHLNN